MSACGRPREVTPMRYECYLVAREGRCGGAKRGSGATRDETQHAQDDRWKLSESLCKPANGAGLSARLRQAGLGHQ